ncbi:MAG: Hsp70 family protein, partial [Candidatus Omnitrophica bacterium]|nr:Hsp70 family protein [Candidatus Omnitrophota bacterium]
DKLSETDIDKMVKEAEKYADDDKKRKEAVELKNKADGLVYATDKSLKDYGEKISEADKNDIQSKLDSLKETLKQNDASADQIQKGIDELTKASHKLAEQVYKAQSAAQQAAPGADQAQAEPNASGGPQEDAGSKPNGENVVDAEYKEEDGK